MSIGRGGSLNVRTPVEVAASIAFSLGIASITGVPWVLTITRGFDDGLERPDVYAGDEDDGEPEAEEAWDPIPVRAPQVAVLSKPAPPAKKADPTPPPPAPSVAEVAPKVVSALPPVDGGTAVALPVIDPLALLDQGFGVEPDPDVEDPEDGAPEDVVADGDDNDGLADASGRVPRRSGLHKTRPKGARPKGATPKPPCTEDNPAIAEIEPGHWAVNRSLVEYYATHPLEFESIATYVVTHKDAAEQPDGFKVGLKRCGVLWETGFRSGDVVHAVNTRTISTIMQAVGAYLALRDESEFVVNVTRKGGDQLELHYTLVDDTREDRHLMRDFLRAAREARREEKADARERERATRGEPREGRRGGQ